MKIIETTTPYTVFNATLVLSFLYGRISESKFKLYKTKDDCIAICIDSSTEAMAFKLAGIAEEIDLLISHTLSTELEPLMEDLERIRVQEERRARRARSKKR